MEKEKFNPCSLSIIKTLSYSGVFNYPLSLYQISTNLISENYFSAKKIKRELKELEKNELIKKEDKRYFLSVVEPVNWRKRKIFTDEFLHDNLDVLKSLKKIPWIKMIAITGSSANYNMDENADLDLLFVTKKNRLWLTRGFVFLILIVLNKLPKEKDKRKICPNIFIDERNLSWAKKKRNLYVAQNIISMQPILDKDDTYFRFMKANNWVKKYYHNFEINSLMKFPPAKSSISFILRMLESISMFFQILYMKKNISKEVTTDKLIHFNKNDNSKWVLTKYKKILKGVKNPHKEIDSYNK